MMVVPCVAIGGITVENAQPLIEAGADFLAVSSGSGITPTAGRGGESVQRSVS